MCDLGSLYDRIASLLICEDNSMAKRELSRLSDWYGAENVKFILRVIAEDMGK